MPAYNPNDYKKPDGAGRQSTNLLPVGKHIVQVSDHELGETSGGHGQIIVTFRAENGQTRKAWLIFEGRAGFHFGSLLEACEWTEPIADLEDVAAVRDAIYDKWIQIVVRSEMYQGNEEIKVKYINKAPGGTGQPRRTPADGYSAGHSAPTSGAAAGDEDIPF